MARARYLQPVKFLLPVPTTRAGARRQIVQSANRHRAGYGSHYGRPLPLFAMRHLQQAVRVVRHHQLVRPETLTLAGFQPQAAR